MSQPVSRSERRAEYRADPPGGELSAGLTPADYRAARDASVRSASVSPAQSLLPRGQIGNSDITFQPANIDRTRGGGSVVTGNVAGDGRSDGAPPYRGAGDQVAGQPGAGGEQAQRAAAQQQLEQAQRLLTSDSATPEQKLRVVHMLAQAGVGHIQLQDKDGHWRNYSIREQQSGSRRMVHLFSTDDQGKEHIVLRGLMGADGSIKNEKDRKGHVVGLEGDWWSRHMVGRTAFGASGNRLGQRQHGYSYQPGNSYQPQDSQSGQMNPSDLNGQPAYAGGEQPGATGFREALAQAGEARGRRGGGGWCARGVREAAAACGLNLPSNGSATGMRAGVESDPRWAEVDHPERGDLIFRDHGPAGRARYGGRNPGDVGIYLGGGMQANDHIQGVKPNGAYYATMRFFRFIG